MNLDVMDDALNLRGAAQHCTAARGAAFCLRQALLPLSIATESTKWFPQLLVHAWMQQVSAYALFTGCKVGKKLIRLCFNCCNSRLIPSRCAPESLPRKVKVEKDLNWREQNGAAVWSILIAFDHHFERNGIDSCTSLPSSSAFVDLETGHK